jgi:hypothetical protein
VSERRQASAPLDDELLLLGERDAVRRHLDGINSRMLARLLVGFAVVAGAYTVALASRGTISLAAVAAVNLAACIVVRRNIGHPAIRTRVRASTAAFLLVQYVLLLVYHPGPGVDSSPWAFVMPLLALLLRFDAAELALLLAGLLAITAGPAVVAWLAAAAGGAARAGTPGGALFPQLNVSVVVFALSMALKRRSSRRFLAWWRGEVERHREHLRMKQELEHARDVQLSMLPRESPGLGWLDVASVSLPATEVGGDYYDYFSVDENRLAVVVGDVAGHGLTSGLVLSGVRAGLNMLEAELAAPETALTRLNRMLVRTTPRGIIVTLLVAVVDRASHSLVLANAGNPPPLRHDVHSGAVEELTSGSLPLGVRPDAVWDEVVVGLVPGDTLLLFTDGLAEITDHAGRQYGYGRVSTAFAVASRQSSAKAVRDELLRDAWSFKGTAEQIDDVTLVVLRRRTG